MNITVQQVFRCRKCGNEFLGYAWMKCPHCQIVKENKER